MKAQISLPNPVVCPWALTLPFVYAVYPIEKRVIFIYLQAMDQFKRLAGQEHISFNNSV